MSNEIVYVDLSYEVYYKWKTTLPKATVRLKRLDHENNKVVVAIIPQSDCRLINSILGEKILEYPVAHFKPKIVEIYDTEGIDYEIGFRRQVYEKMRHEVVKEVEVMDEKVRNLEEAMLGHFRNVLGVGEMRNKLRKLLEEMEAEEG